MGGLNDLTGTRFGKLTVLHKSNIKKGTNASWECICDCGNTTIVSSSALKSGSTKSCGCLRKELLSRDLTGKKFGRLTAIRDTKKRRHGTVVWECKCDCGNTTEVPSGSLISGGTKSCGCLRGELKIIDLVGQRFDKLLVVRLTDTRKNSKILWECLCDCGNTTFVTSSYLKSNGIKSCGCTKQKLTPNANAKDISGQRFGTLTAICPTEKRENGNIVWECLCDCGETTFINISRLTRGRNLSCGCKGDRYNLTGQEFGRLTAIRPLETRQHGHIIWECKCRCGNTVFVRSSILRSGAAQSCGCYQTIENYNKD